MILQAKQKVVELINSDSEATSGNVSVHGKVQNSKIKSNDSEIYVKESISQVKMNCLV